MNTAAAWRVGTATDPGLERTTNEDRILVDEFRGVFLVVDGLGGHAAGELAAETAVQIVSEELTLSDGDIEAQVRNAITRANNRIYELGQQNPEWHGMACVLTLAVAHENRVTVGHVGDSRMYLVWNGNLRKITSDHSPVGEQEDAGELTELEAMRHPRRNEVFRDVGSQLREPNDAQFIDVKSFLFRPDAALLLSSDGLTDVITSAEISKIIERYDGNPEHTARALVDAANEGGGKDNISVVFVAGPQFLGSEASSLVEVRSRHAITRMRRPRLNWVSALKNTLWLVAGMVLGILLWASLERLTPRPTPPPVAPKEEHTPRGPVQIPVNASDPMGIVNALASAQPGDTIHIAPGEYLGPVQLKERVNLISDVPQAAVIRTDPGATADSGAAIVARGLHDVRVEGLRITGDASHPLRTGVLMIDSSIELDDLDISGATEAGIRFEGTSGGTLLANFVHGNTGPGIVIKDQSAPRLVGNRVIENGKASGSPAKTPSQHQKGGASTRGA